MKGFEPSQPKPRREAEQKEMDVPRQLLLASEGGSSGGGEVIQSVTIAEEEIPSAASSGFEEREVSDATANKNQAYFKATSEEFGKDTSDMQPPSIPCAMDTVQWTKGSMLKEEESGKPADKTECSVGFPPAQLSQIASSQIREVGSAGFSIGRVATDKPRNNAKLGKAKVSKIVGEREKIGIGPDSQMDSKKGQWTRITNLPNPVLKEVAIHEAEGPKRKASEL